MALCAFFGLMAADACHYPCTQRRMQQLAESDLSHMGRTQIASVCICLRGVCVFVSLADCFGKLISA